MKKIPFLLLVLALLYIPLFPERLTTEPSFRPVWAVETSDAGGHTAEDANGADGADVPAFPFQSAEWFGYHTATGNVLVSEAILDGVAIGASGFVNYTSLGNDLVIQRPDGVVDASLDTRGYPIMLEDRLFVVSTNRSRIEEWSMAGERVWERDFGALVTSFDARGPWFVAGLLDGTVMLIDDGGRIVLSYRVGGSRIDVVYGCTVTESGDRVVIIHGVEPQMLTILEHEESGYIASAQWRLGSESRGQRLVYAPESGDIVYVEDESEIGVFSVDHGLFRSIPLPGVLVDFGSLSGVVLNWFVSSERYLSAGAEPTSEAIRVAGRQSGASLLWTTRTGEPVFLEDLDTTHISGVAGENTLYLSVDASMGRIDLVKR